MHGIRRFLGKGFVMILAALSSAVSAQEVAMVAGETLPENAVWLESLNLDYMTEGWGLSKPGRSIVGNPLTLKGHVFPHGVGTHAFSEFRVRLDGTATKFLSMVGIDDEVSSTNEAGGTANFEVWVDGRKTTESGVMRRGDEPKLLSADLTGAKRMKLIVDDVDGQHLDHADWAGALILLAPGAKGKLAAEKIPVDPPISITSGISDKPSINGPRIVGGTPGRPFLFLIPATGKSPLTYSARGLPEGLTLDAGTGILSGTLATTGTFTAEITVRGPAGAAKRDLSIVAGQNKLALTPPMGWNSWNCWGTAVSDEKVRLAADWLVKSGLAAHGYQYINIDDAWEAGRDANGEIQCNSKFPDMKALADYVHSKGLKLGIYSSPGPKTCGGYEGSYRHEEQDAKTYAKLGIDYLKYDWCSYGGVVNDDTSTPTLKKPYAVMRAALDRCGRDIVYSLCQYGMGNVWEWGAEVGGNLWRTTGDITDVWQSMAAIGFDQNGKEKNAGPGHWNDPDMLVLGKVGWGPNLHNTHLKPNEQITHMSLWCLLAAPLLIGCDLSQIDKFTFDLLTNDEVLAVNQDPLGRQAWRVAQDGSLEVWAKPLEDGTLAVGLFNRRMERAQVTARWADLKLDGPQPVRDLWQKKDLGRFKSSFTAEVPSHGGVLVRIGTPKPRP